MRYPCTQTRIFALQFSLLFIGLSRQAQMSEVPVSLLVIRKFFLAFEVSIFFQDPDEPVSALRNLFPSIFCGQGSLDKESLAPVSAWGLRNSAFLIKRVNIIKKSELYQMYQI